MPRSARQEREGQRKCSRQTPGRRRNGGLLGLLVALLLAGCTAWTNPTKQSSAFADDAATCKDEATQAALTSGQFDLDQDNAYITCMRAKGWELQYRRSYACFCWPYSRRG
jgi:ferric-dicitrate binding protein FerR (iron transport regulator)